MAEFDWTGLLARWSADVLRSRLGRSRADLITPEMRARRWLGYPPATEAQLAALEGRLGTRLPPSYRAFLATTNGWSVATSFAGLLLPAEEVGWLRDRDPELVAVWCAASAPTSPDVEVVQSVEANVVQLADRRVDVAKQPDVQDAERPVAARLARRPLDAAPEELERAPHASAAAASADAPYVDLLARHLPTTLQVSDPRYLDRECYLLNPQVVTPGGEWEAWFFAHWVPGARCYGSFWELMQGEHAAMLRLMDVADEP